MNIDLAKYGSADLTPWARKYLRDRGVSKKVAQLNNLRSLTAAETAELYGPRFAFESLLLPFSAEYGTARIRVPKKRAKDKFRTTAGQGTRIYRPQRPAGQRRLKERLLIVEGPFKALACASHGFDAIGIAGCWNWQKGREPLPELKAMEWRGMGVVPIFDADVADKMQVGQAFLALGDWLSSEGARVTYVRMPKIAGATTGADDYLAKKGAKALQKRVKHRGEEWLESLEVAKLRNDLLRDTEGGLAQRFLAEHVDNVLYDPGENTWYVYNYSGIWEPQPKSLPEVQELMLETVRGISAEAVTIRDERTRKHRQKWALRCDNQSTMRGAINLASSSPQIRTSFDEFDREPDIVGAQNGILDLRKRELVTATKEQRVSRRLAVPFLPEATCPVWKGFIAQVMCDENGKPDAELAQFIQDLCGYLLTSGNPERLIFFLYGVGRNGKTVFIETVLALMGDYGEVAQSAMLMRRGNLERDSESAQPFMLKLRGKRYITGSEVREGSAIDGGVVKALTGGDKITVRGLHSKPVDFVTEGVIVVRCNHRPQIDTNDLAMWDRVVEIPFNFRVPENRQDGNLKQKLRAELPGILNWALVGLQRYYKKNWLKVPESVQRQTAAYKAAMDSIAQFARACLRRRPKATVSRSYVYEHYERWCFTRSRPGVEVEPKSRQEFYEGIGALGFKSKKRDGTRFFKHLEVIE